MYTCIHMYTFYVSVDKESEGQAGNDRKVMALLMGMQQQEVKQVSCMTHCSHSFSPRSTDSIQSEQIGFCFSLDEVSTKTKRNHEVGFSKIIWAIRFSQLQSIAQEHVFGIWGYVFGI